MMVLSTLRVTNMAQVFEYNSKKNAF